MGFSQGTPSWALIAPANGEAAAHSSQLGRCEALIQVSRDLTEKIWTSTGVTKMKTPHYNHPALLSADQSELGHDAYQLPVGR